MASPTVFEQVVNLVPRSQFEAWVHQHSGDKGVRSHSCWTWFGALLFGQLSGHDSIRALERVFSQSNPRIRKLGFEPIRRSTLADANRTRPLEILESVFEHALRQAQLAAPKQARGLQFSGAVYALDSTMIELCLSLSPWAQYHNSKYRQDAHIKLHTAIDLAGDLPQFAVVTPAKITDIRVARTLECFQKGDTVVFDRGYIDGGWYKKLDDEGVHFVTRAKVNMAFKVRESRATDRTQGLICDQVVRLKNNFGRVYRKPLRRISYRDPETNKRLVFLTNQFNLPAQTICALYRSRWKVELFFRTLKQHLKIRKFLGTSRNAVKAQILVALIAYLLMQRVRFSHDVRISMTATMAAVGTLLLLREPLKRILGDLPRTIRYPCASQLILNL